MGSVRHRNGETVVHLPLIEGAKDAHGNPVKDWGPGADRPGCAVEPRVQETTTELGRVPVVSGFVVYDAFDTPITEGDRVKVRGTAYLVDGEVARWRNPFTGQKKGAVVTLKHVEG